VDPTTAKLIEFGLVFGGVLGIAVWQWVSVRRELRRDDERERAVDEERRRPPGG
jgi:Na+/glutamate symporter